jgi:hypothetical protein
MIVEWRTMTVTTPVTITTVTLACAWCRRENGGASADARTIVGLCEDHVRAFSTRVDDLLASCAALRKKKDARRDASVEVPATQGVADILRHHGGLTFCDACLAAEVGRAPEHVAIEAERLDGAEFLRDQWRCARCGARGLVTRARVPRAGILGDVAKAA